MIASQPPSELRQVPSAPGPLPEHKSPFQLKPEREDLLGEVGGVRGSTHSAETPPTTGTLTFLFTDIEASTRRWDDHAEAMSTALARHDELLRLAVGTHGGTVFKHTGDGICAVFATAPTALSAAVAAQQSLQGEPWAEVEPLRVRMALHSGTAEFRDRDYFGPSLNRSARLLATAHGGQIVMSLPAEELARDSLPPDVGLVDLGEHRLADLGRPERAFQVTHPQLPVTFPPLRSLDAYRHNLPLAVTAFIGRERELEQVGELLGACRLVTLTGIGGVGKTRLALQVASAALEAFSDGVFLVELAPFIDPALVIPKSSRPWASEAALVMVTARRWRGPASTCSPGVCSWSSTTVNTSSNQ